MNAEQLRTASRLWKEGESGRIIAKTVGVKVNRLFDVAARYRHLFPKRLRAVEARTHFIAPVISEESELPHDRMRWVTESGATVTLPRISFIKCPRSAQAEKIFKKEA